ncbi:AAA family ATPase [Pseudolysinimonas sp.]|jgi:predicted kinase|uniref:AAA family ATPase n=1 Tax=Pseudolysinimonas sp. TaxID=2680009 RepID=UPI0037842B7C
MLVVMAGLPGTGKSTVGEAAAALLGLPIVSVDPVESAILSAGIDADQPTGLAAYLVTETIAESVIASVGGVVVDAVNAVEPARNQWLKLATRRGIPIRFVEVICSDESVHRARLEARGRQLAHIAEPSWHAVEQSLDEWEPWGGETGAVPRITVDSVHPVPVLVEQVVAFVRS